MGLFFNLLVVSLTKHMGIYVLQSWTFADDSANEFESQAHLTQKALKNNFLSI